MAGKKDSAWTTVCCPNGCGYASRPGPLARHLMKCGRVLTVDMIAEIGKVDTTKVDDCWVWNNGSFLGKGYGRCLSEYAHREMYKAAYGAITPGMEVCHACDNPPCVNPKHLWLGTSKDNSQDQLQKGRYISPFVDPVVRAKAAESRSAYYAKQRQQRKTNKPAA